MTKSKTVCEPDILNVFRKEFIYWVIHFGLTDWELHFHREDLSAKGNVAEITYAIDTRRADITLGLSIDEHEAKKSALHEALELLLGEFCELAEKRWGDYATIQGARHAVIARLANYLLRTKEAI